MSLKCILQGQQDLKIEEHIADKNNPHEVTIEQIGAAPAGFGLGENPPQQITDANDALKGGWYSWSTDCKNVPFDYGCIRVDPRANWNGYDVM